MDGIIVSILLEAPVDHIIGDNFLESCNSVRLLGPSMGNGYRGVGSPGFFDKDQNPMCFSGLLMKPHLGKIMLTSASPRIALEAFTGISLFSQYRMELLFSIYGEAATAEWIDEAGILYMWEGLTLDAYPRMLQGVQDYLVESDRGNQSFDICMMLDRFAEFVDGEIEVSKVLRNG